MRWITEEGYVGIEGPFRVLSSAPWHGGLRPAPRIVNVQVPFDFDHDVGTFFRKFEREHHLPGSVGFLTAVDVRTAVRRKCRSHWLLVTAGVGNPSRVGTINILLAVAGNPSPAAQVELVKMVTEAKVAALYDLDIRAGPVPATGTSTDGVAIAATGNGPKFDYAGPATSIGRAIGRDVRQAVRDALRAYHGWDETRPIPDRLRERGWSEKDVQRLGPVPARLRSEWESAFGLDEAHRAGRLPLVPMRGKPYGVYSRALWERTLRAKRRTSRSKGRSS